MGLWIGDSWLFSRFVPSLPFISYRYCISVDVSDSISRFGSNLDFIRVVHQRVFHTGGTPESLAWISYCMVTLEFRIVYNRKIRMLIREVIRVFRKIRMLIWEVILFGYSRIVFSWLFSRCECASFPCSLYLYWSGDSTPYLLFLIGPSWPRFVSLVSMFSWASFFLTFSFRLILPDLASGSPPGHPKAFRLSSSPLRSE